MLKHVGINRKICVIGFSQLTDGGQTKLGWKKDGMASLL